MASKKLYRRLTLRRADGRVYLNRWGFGHDRIGKVLLHRMDAPDPGIDLHDHPWSFLTIILWGGYTEERASIRDAERLATVADVLDDLADEQHPRGEVQRVRWLSARLMRLDECHRITELRRKTSWSLVICGPVRRGWGFYTSDGYVPEPIYDQTIRAGRRDLWSDQNADERPWSES